MMAVRHCCISQTPDRGQRNRDASANQLAPLPSSGCTCDGQGSKRVALIGLLCASSARLCYISANALAGLPGWSIGGPLTWSAATRFCRKSIHHIACGSIAKVGPTNAGRAMAWSGIATSGAVALGAAATPGYPRPAADRTRVAKQKGGCRPPPVNYRCLDFGAAIATRRDQRRFTGSRSGCPRRRVAARLTIPYNRFPCRRDFRVLGCKTCA
jgi:hypothetical protein